MITTQKHRYNKGFNESVLFFPQMRPEKKISGLDLGTKSIGWALRDDDRIIDMGIKITPLESDEIKSLERNPILEKIKDESQKLIVEVLSKYEYLEIEELKIHVNLSNKKLDKTIKQLRKDKIIEVNKIEEKIIAKLSPNKNTRDYEVSRTIRRNIRRAEKRREIRKEKLERLLGDNFENYFERFGLADLTTQLSLFSIDILQNIMNEYKKDNFLNLDDKELSILERISSNRDEMDKSPKTT